MATTPANCAGFEIPDITAYGVAAGTAPTISTAHPRTGSSALRCAATTAKSSLTMQQGNNQWGWATATGRLILRFGFYVETLPSTQCQMLSGANFKILLNNAGVLQAVCGAGAGQNGDANATLVAGQYYIIEVEVDTSTASNWKVNWRVNNQVQTQATDTSNATAPNITQFSPGNSASGANATFAFHYDDLLVSSTSGDYPLGNGYGQALKINACGTHSITTGVFQDDTATVLIAGETASYTHLNEATPDSTTWVKQTVGKVADYLEYAFADTGGPSATPQMVRCAVYASTNSGGGADGSWRFRDGTTNTTGSTTGSTTFNWRELRQQVRSGGQGAWTTAAIDGLLIRVGFATAATNEVRLSWAIIEVDYTTAAFTLTESMAGAETPTGALTKEVDTSKAGTVTPAGTLTRSAGPHEAGTLTLAGSLSISITRMLTGTLTPQGAITRAISRSYAGMITPVGAVAKETDISMSGSLTPAGTLARGISIPPVGGAITPSGSLLRSISVALGGTLTPAGALIRVDSRFFAGTLTPHGAVAKQIAKTFRGKVTPTVIRCVTGGPPGTGGGPGDGTGGVGGGVTTLAGCPCTVSLIVGCGFTVIVGTALTSGPRRRNLLGCGTYQVFLTTRGGRSIVVDIPWNSLQWGRLLSDTSQATVIVQGVSSVSDLCSRGLEQIRPRKHEVAIYRSSYLVWAGPVSAPLKVEGDTLTITASDLSSWFDRRRIRRDITMTADLAEILVAYVDAAMESDPSPRLLIEGDESGIIGQRSVLAAQHQLAGALIRELATAGVPWTVERRTMHYGLPVTPTDPIALLLDDSYVDQPSVEIIDIAANDLVVAGQGTGEAGDAIYGYARDAASQSEYGLLDGVYRESLILDGTSAQARADDDLALVRIPPTIVNGGTLTPFAPVLIDQLVPGVQIDNRLLISLFPVRGPFQLTKLDVQAGNDGSEQVAVTFQPVTSAS